MSTAYTPGPWIAREPRNHVEIRTTDLTGNIALVFGTMLSNDPKHPINQTRDANARLIASAPALLEALHLLTESAAELERQAVIVCSRTGAKEPCLSNAATVAQLGIERARLAIAQATGGTK